MSINSLLNQNGTIYPKSATGSYDQEGRDISDTGSSFASKCRFQNQTKTKLMPNGQIISLLGIIYLPGDTVINTEDRVVIGGISYKVFSVNGAIDGAGNQRIVKCEVQKWQV